MPGLAELSAVMMQGAERRIGVSADNVSNMTTPGYRSRRVFSQIVDLRSGIPQVTEAFVRSRGPLVLKPTSGGLDLATEAGSVLVLRSGNTFFQTRSAQLKRDGEGRVVDAQGRFLQAAGGGDVVLGSGAPSILKDGTVVIDGQAQARIGLFLPSTDHSGLVPIGASTGFEALPDGTEAGVLHQGMVVPADVDAASEMIELNRAGRMAETGAKVFQLYDDLLGRAASLLGDTRK